MNRTGAQLIVEAFRREGVDTVFGYPGGAVIPLFDALYEAPDIRLILVRHEQAAVHAADGYARASGKVGVCIATSGPGATNTVTGLATARFDSQPLVCVTGQVALSMIGNDAFQEADTVGITQPVTKHNYLARKRAELGTVLRNSFHLAGTGRPGPVVVDVPKDVQLEILDDEYPESASLRGYKPVTKPDPAALAALADAVNQAERPLFFVGGGVVISGAGALVDKALAITEAPYVTSLMGIGALDSFHPSALGMIGMHGSVSANRALTACDLVVGLGVRYDDRATGDTARFAPRARLAHIDIDPSSIGRNIRVELPVVAELGEALEALLPLLRPRDRSAWKAEVEGYRKEEATLVSAELAEEKERRALGKAPSPRQVMRLVNDVFPGSVIATEVGQHQMWAAQFLRFYAPRRWLSSGGLGTMGFGFPAGIGAQAAVDAARRGAESGTKARPTGDEGRPVVVLAGDGSFQMNIQELGTCVQEGLNLVVIVLNNGYLGMVRQWQELFFSRRYSATCLQSGPGCPKGCSTPGPACPDFSPDFAAVARAYGAAGYTAATLDELEAAARAAKAVGRPAVIDCRIEREEEVWPIVPPGKGNDQMLYRGEMI
ncbi:MAG TPA: biosynthetic-type acetolactate synthase large subunit [Rectinemataceae bacterium]